MQSRAFGSVQVPVLGIGTWKMEYDERAAAIAAIRRAVELGMTHVDTAELYGSGGVETLVAKALDGLRDRVFLVSKVLPHNASYAGTLEACEKSLRRLRTDVLDCYLLHWRGDEPLAETFRAFEKLREQGKIRAWGVSNFDHDDLAEALSIAGEGRIACNQVAYHLGNRTIEHHVIPFCEQHRIAVVAYSPFGSGLFHSTPKLDAIAQRVGATPHQLVLAFLTRRPPRVTDPSGPARPERSVLAIPKSANVTHVEELAHTVSLDDATIREIDALYPLRPWRGLHTL
ncbi:MAG TPA: aldo/keto reductase [Kofleriaceae bacterium]|nr:aldo/keto reductase [Kofleriaceae bacterium]